MPFNQLGIFTSGELARWDNRWGNRYDVRCDRLSLRGLRPQTAYGAIWRVFYLLKLLDVDRT
jgi:hypothetical protein